MLSQNRPEIGVYHAVHTGVRRSASSESAFIMLPRRLPSLGSRSARSAHDACERPVNETRHGGMAFAKRNDYEVIRPMNRNIPVIFHVTLVTLLTS